MIKVGDTVSVRDGSWSQELVNGEWKNSYPAMPSRQHERWVVIAVNANLPTEDCPRASARNSVLLANRDNPAWMLCSQPHFLTVRQTQTLQERVDELEARVDRLGG